MLAVSVEPSIIVPEIVGAEVFTGAGVGTTGVAAEVALADPPAFVAVTVTSIVSPTSPAATV